MERDAGLRPFGQHFSRRVKAERLIKQAMEGFFNLLRLTLRNADRQNLPTMIKSIFAFFLDVFDLRHRLQKREVDQDVSYSRTRTLVRS